MTTKVINQRNMITKVINLRNMIMKVINLKKIKWKNGIQKCLRQEVEECHLDSEELLVACHKWVEE
jgi:hypothetical protein